MSNYFEIIIFSFVVITSINVLIVNNPVQSLLWLITTFAISSIFLINLNFNGNIFLMGSVIYNYNFVLFLILGLVLFVAMISSIVLLVNWNVKSSRLNVYNNLYFFNRRKIFFIK